ncbi:MAG: hypothetical protein PW734_06410 [Verrucomicrobium sp.]|nr:hypothetical protein [Verrucomicrobium sp.]
MSDTIPPVPTETKTSCCAGGECAWMDCFSWQIPLAILLATLLFTNTLEFINLFGQRNRLADGQKQLTLPEVQNQLRQAALVSQKLDQLARGIVSLAPSDAAAKKIQEDFRITVRGPEPKK